MRNGDSRSDYALRITRYSLRPLPHLEMVFLVAQEGLDVGDLPVMVHQVEGREAGALRQWEAAERQIDRIAQAGRIDLSQCRGVISSRASERLLRTAAVRRQRSLGAGELTAGQAGTH